MSRTAAVIANDGTITLIHGGSVHTIGTDHINYNRIVSAIKSRHYERLDKLLDVVATIRKIENVTVKDGRVFWHDEEIGGPIVDKIMTFIRERLPLEPLARFINNLMANPSNRSVSELYGFLIHKGLAITDDGCFLAYKGIRDDWMDIYTGQVDNHIGQKPSLPRNKVDDNCNNTCSNGYHVGSFAYAVNYAGSNGRVVLVKVNPADAVSVPTDHNGEKLRVTTYEVMQECQRVLESEYQGSMVGEPDDEGEGWNDGDDNENLIS
jgi:hypothetical protein